MSAAIAPEADSEVGLWSVGWFRVLTVVNASLVAGSVVVGLLMAYGEPGTPPAWAILALPVVPTTVMAPVVSLVIVAGAAALSSLNMYGRPQKGARFLRAMTVWGTIALTVPVAIAGFWYFPALIGSLS